MHKVSANYTLPTVLNTLQPVAVSGLRKAVNPKTGSATATGTASGAGSSTASGIGSTFLSLLRQNCRIRIPRLPWIRRRWLAR